MQDVKTLIKMMHQVYDILTPKQRKQMVGIFFLILMGSCMELLGVTAILPFIEAIMTPEALLEKGYIRLLVRMFGISNNSELILTVGICIVLIYVLKNIFLSWSAYVQAAFNSRTQKDISVGMYESYMKRSYEFFVGEDSGKILRGINNDVNGVFIVSQYIFKTLSQILTIVVIVIYLFSVNTFMTFWVVMLGLVCFATIILGIKKKISKAGQVSRQATAITSAWAVQTIGGMKDIFVFGKRDYAKQKYEDFYNDKVKATIVYEFISALPTYLIEMVCASGIIIIVLVQLHLGVDMETFVPKLSVFAMGAFKLLPAIAAVSGNVGVFIFHRPTVEGAHKNITSAREYMKSINSQVSSENDTLSFESSIEAKDICWRYKGRDEDVIHNLNLTINKGDSIGIVGESGAGKSTLADILLHLYRPQSGHIYMDGVDINTIPDAWNRNLSYVSQTVFLFNDTIRVNVNFGDENSTDEKVWEALEKASLAEFVRNLPDGLDTIVGERGVKFSGGQRQRVAIARALYTNPTILILDEATSALDNETEEAVMEAIDNLQGQLTMVIIAHRLTTIRNCSRVFEIRDGVAIERDTADFQ